jgi:glutaminyl-tRNA synthetase
VVKDDNGEITAIHCTYDNDSLSGSGTEASKRKVKGTLHWVSIEQAVKVEVRVYDRLFLDEAPDSHKDKDFIEFLNPNSLKINKQAYVEPSLSKAKVGEQFQFQRLGYFVVDPDSTESNKVFNRTVALKDSWKKKKEKTHSNTVQKVEEWMTEVFSFAGKYLKSREEDERLDLVKKIYKRSENALFSKLIDKLKTANSNKDFLAYLMIFNSKQFKVDFNNPIYYDVVDNFVGTALKMKNSYVRYQAVDFIGKYPEFKEKHLDLLKTMLVEDKNTRIIARLKEYL